VFEEAFEIGGLGEEVETQLDETSPAFSRFLKLGLHHLVPCASDDDTNTFGGANRRWKGLMVVRHDSQRSRVKGFVRPVDFTLVREWPSRKTQGRSSGVSVYPRLSDS
jgi:hypothetical protein